MASLAWLIPVLPLLAGGVMDEYALRAMRIAPGTAFWEDPIIGTNSTPDAMGNYVHVTNFNPSVPTPCWPVVSQDRNVFTHRSASVSFVLYLLQDVVLRLMKVQTVSWLEKAPAYSS